MSARSAEYNVLYLFTPKESLAEKTRKGQGAQRQSYHFVTQVADELETLARTREQRVPANLGGSSGRLRRKIKSRTREIQELHAFTTGNSRGLNLDAGE